MLANDIEITKYYNNLFKNMGAEKYCQYRKDRFGEVISLFPELVKESGRGLDLGTGLVSIFEFSPLDIFGVDFMHDKFRKIFDFKGKVRTVNNKKDELPFSDGFFDFIVFVDALDHCCNPLKVVNEVYRVLRKGGKVYIAVEFRKEPDGAHYHLWDKKSIGDLFSKFELVRENESQIYSGIFKK